MAEQAPSPDPPLGNTPMGPSSPMPGRLPAKPPHRSRRWLKIVLLVVAVVLVFIAILPTLLSMGWARRIAENKANAHLHGKLAIGDWSVGWFSGARLGAVNLYDAAGQPVLQLASVNTHLSISDMLRGNFDLGTVPVTGLRLFITREPDGTLNLQHLLPPKHVLIQGPASQPTPGPPPPSPPPAAAPPAKLPNISVDLELVDCQATFTDARTGETVSLPISGSVKIPNINQPITNDLIVDIIGPKGAHAGNLELAGSIAAAHDNQLDANQPAVDETLRILGLDLSAVQPMCAQAFSTLAGRGGGQFSLRLAPHAAGSVQGAMSIGDIRAAGRATAGDTFSADSLSFIAPKTALPTAAGLDAIATTTDRLTTASPIGIVLDQGEHISMVDLDVDTPMSALHNLLKNRPPGAAGKIEIAASSYFASLANQLPHLLRLRPGVSLNCGELKASAGIVMTATDATPSASLTIDKIVGTHAGKPITLHDIAASASAYDLPGGGAMPALQNLQAQFTSVFATGSLDAPTPSQIHGQFTAQLAAMQKELGQVFDFGTSAISGGIVANLSSQAGDNSDPAAAKTSTLQGSLIASNLRLDRAGMRAVDIPAVNYTLAGTIYHNASRAIQEISGLDLTGTVGPADRPAAATHFSTDLAFGRNSSVVASNVNVSGTVNIPELRRELGSADASEKIPTDYALKWALAATAAYSPSASSIDIPVFSITDNHGLIAIQRVGKQDIRFATGAARRQVSPIGTVSISADLAGLDAMLGGKTLQSGHLDATLALSGDSTVTQFTEQCNTVGMTVLTGKRSRPLSTIQVKSSATFGPGDELTVSDFSAQGAGGEVHLKQPLVIATSAGRIAAIHAELVGGGDIAQAMAFLAAFQPNPTPASYVGSYTLDQSISTTAGVITANGSIHGNVSIAHNGGAADFAEPDFIINNDLAYDQAHSVADLTNLSLDMHGTGAFRLALRGKISDLSARRELKGVSATLHYDSAELWKLIYATLTPAQRESYKDVKLAGAVDREFIAAGSYPAGRPFNQAIKSLVIQGGLAVPSFQGQGMTITNLDLPLSLKNGLLFIAQPTPATLNGGTMSVNGATVDLADPHRRLSIPDNTALFQDVSLNPLFVKKAAGWVNNPLFVGTDKAAGILNVTVDHCVRLPTDDLVKATTPDNDGMFHMHMTLGRVQIGAPMLADVSKSIAPLVGGKFDVPSLEGEIPHYTLDIAKGIMTTDMTMNLTAKKRPLKLAGTVALASEKLNMTLDLPSALFGGDHSPLTDIAGDSLRIPITGTIDHPQFDIKSLLKKNLKNPGKDLNDILKGIGG